MDLRQGPPSSISQIVMLGISGWRGSCAAYETEEGGPCHRSMAQVMGCEQLRRATTARVGRDFHRAIAAAVAMDLGPPSSVGGRDVGEEGGDK